MSELDLAIEYLKKRAISTEKNKELKHLTAVNPTFEVQAVLDMVKKGTFVSWYNQMKEEHGRVFP